MSKTVDQKLKECKELYIQNLERNAVQKNMVFMYLKENKLDAEVRNLTMNSRQGIAKLEFESHEKAKNFYDNLNFKGAILLRPFNIYFNLQLSDDQMKKFYLEGITQENQRKLFEAARKITVCKLYTNYTQPLRGKIKSTGVLSFIRKEQISEKQMTQLKGELQELGIKIQKYVAEKDLKCSIRLSNFYKGNLNEDQEVISKKVEDELKETLGKVTKNSITSITVNVKSKEIQGDKEETKHQKSVVALIQFSDTPQTMDNFELIRDFYQNNSQIRAILFFHNDQNNSYLSLFTNNLQKPQSISQKEFEGKLLEIFKKINPNVIQVNVYPVHRNQTHVGRVYLRSEADGKNFIVDYTSKRELLVPFYKDKNSITFNINVDAKTLGKIKHAQKRANEMMNRVKNFDQTLKRGRNQNQGVNKIIHSNLPPFFGVPGPMHILPGGPGMGILPPQNLMVGSNIPPPNVITRNENFKQIALKLIRDKQILVKEKPQTAKKMICNTLKSFVEEQGVSTAQSSVITDLILKNNDVSNILRFLESPQELKNKIKQTKSF